MNPTDILKQLANDFTGSNFSELCSKYPFLMQEVLILLQAHQILTRRPMAQPQAATPEDTESPAALIWEGDQQTLASLHGFSALIQACQGALLRNHRAQFRLTVASKAPTPAMLALNSQAGIPRNGKVLPPVLPVPEALAQAGECTHPASSASAADSQAHHSFSTP